MGRGKTATLSDGAFWPEGQLPFKEFPDNWENHPSSSSPPAPIYDCFMQTAYLVSVTSLIEGQMFSLTFWHLKYNCLGMDMLYGKCLMVGMGWHSRKGSLLQAW